MLYRRLSLPVLFVCLWIGVQSQEVLNADMNEPIICDCGFQDENGEKWGSVWHADFGSYTSKLQQDDNYVVMQYKVGPKHTDSFEREFQRDNVEISNGGAQLAVRNSNGKPTSASFGTKRTDILYGSFRVNMKMSAVPGTVGAFFFYHNNTSEIDMESLSRIQDPWKSYFAIQPQIYEQDGTASPLTHDKHDLSFNPTEAFHEYRFDWVPGSVKYYIDNVLVKTLTTNVPDAPGRILVNHWSDGNPNFSGGPPTEDAILSIANLTMFFNSSETTSTPPCHASQEPCKASDIMNRRILPSPEASGTPQKQYDASSSTTISAQPWQWTSTTLFLAFIFILPILY